ncbi:hypothetical protein BAZOLSSOX_1931 [uncultured Gammaproteobacteria bacterium]|nr:hypothetical protein BAZOLSSOX_1931 [uncultured Gammaproteobacteria bacterium]
MKNFFKKKPTYSRPGAKVIIALLILLLVLYLFKDTINMPTSTSILIAGVMTLIIIFNAIKIYQPKNQGQTILQDLALVAIFLTIISFLIFDISILHRIKFIDTESKITYTSIGKGFIAIIAIYLFYQRLEKQQKQIDIQINQRVDDRFNSAIDLLGSSETSARTGAIYALHELAIEEEKYRRQIAQILCSHIHSKTNESEYKKTHSKRPSNEIQTTIDLLFKEKGLYTKKFARAAEFPKANLSHAYLMGVDFKGAQCQKANFANAQCQKANFCSAQCQWVNFFMAQCQGANFMFAQCQMVDFWVAQCQGVDFRSAQCQGVDFLDTQCQGAVFSNAKFDQPLAIQSEGEISDEAIKAIKGAKPYLDNSWYKKMQKIIKENKGKYPKTVNIQTLAS